MQHRYTLPRSKGHTASVENRNKLAERIISKFISKYDQSDWADYCFTAAYAYNKSVNPVTNYSPDFLVLGTEPFGIVDLATISEPKEDYAKLFVDRLKKAWSVAQSAVAKVFSRERSQVSTGVSFFVDQWVWLSRKSFPNSYIRSLFPKFSRTNLGPFRIVAIDEKLNRVTLQITPSRVFETKIGFISSHNGIYLPENDRFAPFLDEVILTKIPPKVNNVKEKPISDKVKSNYDIKSIVGKRINVLWSNKKFYKATVIGFTTNLAFNLVHFDEPTIDKSNNLPVPQCEDFYKLKLFKNDPQSKIEKWSLLS